MDISMPLMDGFEATRCIRALEANTPLYELNASQNGKTSPSAGDGVNGCGSPDVETAAASRAYVVALTGLGSKRDREEAVESGLDEFLTKPVSFARVGEILEKVAEAKMARFAQFA